MRAVVHAILALLLCCSLSLATRGGASAQTPTPAPTPPGTGGNVFGSVRVSSGNNLPRNPGMENQPPVWITLESKGSSAVVTIGNATRVPLDFTGTVVITLDTGVQPSTVLVSVGTAVLQGNQIVWSNFSLSSGQIVPAIVSLVATGTQVAATTPAIREVSIEAKDQQSGTRVTEQVSGGGPARSALATATPGAPSNSATAQAAATSAGSVKPLSRDDARTFGAIALALLVSMLLALAALVWLVARLGRRPAAVAAPVPIAPLEFGNGALNGAVARLEAVTDALEAANAAGRVAVATLQTAARSLQAAATGIPRHQERASVQHIDAPIGPILLEQRAGTEAGKRWLLEEPELSIGRGPQNDIVVADPRVSEVHARLIRQADGRYLLMDTRSTNGTGVNGRIIVEPVLLRDGDAVRIGGATLVVHDPAVGPEDDTIGSYPNR